MDSGTAAHWSGLLLHLVGSLGFFGLFLVSVVDSSFVPLPIPGVTDIMLVLYAAQHANPWTLLVVSTAGSALGGLLSYQVGQSGGMEFIEKRTPKRIFRRVSRWMEQHAVLAVALPALLPPPMPLSPFVLAAGALKMRRRTFLLTFSVSRLLRHAIAVGLGLYFGERVLGVWNAFTARWGTPLLVIVWGGIAAGLVYAGVQLWRQTHAVHRESRARTATSAAAA